MQSECILRRGFKCWKQKKKPQNLNPWEGKAEQAQLDFSQYHTHIPKIVGLSCNRLQLHVKLIADIVLGS